MQIHIIVTEGDKDPQIVNQIFYFGEQLIVLGLDGEHHPKIINSEQTVPIIHVNNSIIEFHNSETGKKILGQSLIFDKLKEETGPLFEIVDSDFRVIFNSSDRISDQELITNLRNSRKIPNINLSFGVN